MKTTALAATALATVALLTACGSDDESSTSSDSSARSESEETADSTAFVDRPAPEIAQAAKDAMAALDSFAVRGTVTSADQTVELDLATSTDGDCAGSVVIGDATLELIGVDGRSWYRPDDAFWRAQAGEDAQTLIDLVAGRWVVAPADSDDGFAQFCEADELISDMITDDEEGGYETGEVSEIDGTEVVAVTDTDEGDGGTAYIETAEPHRILRIEKTAADQSGSIDFSAFDEPVDATEPAAEDTVDLDQLGS